MPFFFPCFLICLVYFKQHNGHPNYLDMDVIDTTWIEDNVHAMRFALFCYFDLVIYIFVNRHNYFNINRLIVDDVRELLVEHKRASQRK